jgi:hypothetical protein
MVIFGAVAMVIFVVVGGTFLWTIDWGQDDPSDAQFYFFIGSIGAGIPLVWTAMNLGLLMLRRQTGGQYVAGVALTRVDGKPLRIGTLVVWWLALNPLLFSWPMSLTSGTCLLAIAALSLGMVDLVLALLFVLLCTIAPIVALAAAAADARNRTLYDRVADVVVVAM